MKVRLEWVVVLIAAGVLFEMLFTKPFIGVANNGDFLRVMGAGGIDFLHVGETAHDQYYGYAHSTYGYGSFQFGGYFSSQIVLVVLASLIGRMLSREVFDIHVLSAIYSLVMLTAIYVFFKYRPVASGFTTAVLSLLILFVFFDTAYLAYFNSFFGEPVSLVFFLLTLSLAFVIVRHPSPSLTLLVFYFIAAGFLACSKIQNVPIGAAFALLGLRFLPLQEGRVWRRRVLSLSASLLVLSAGVYLAAPKELKHINLYQTVFFGILKDSLHVTTDLHELGLSDELAVLAGTNFFQDDTAIKQTDPRLQSAFYDNISHKDVMLFYLRHPARWVSKLEQAAVNSMSIRPYYLGNFEKSEGQPYGALSYRFSLWSEFKHTYMPNHLWFVVSFYLAYYLIAFIQYVRAKLASEKTFIEIFFLIGAVGLFALMIPLLGDGEADLGKHLFLFNVTFDVMAVSSMGWLLHTAVQLFHRLAAKSRTTGSSF
ncbi:glycan biosynthesis hexose transferase WsfD [Paenibacillus hexagrammi]